MIPKSNRGFGCGGGKSSDRGDSISFQLLLGTSASSNESEQAFPLCLDEEDVDSLSPREVSLNFYLEDGTCQRLVVEENLRAIDLCHLLPLKIGTPRSYTWTLVEQLTDWGIERSLEDHEEVLQVYGDWGGPDLFSPSSRNRFLFRQDFRKYEFFHSAQQFFPLNMLDMGESFDCLTESTELAKLITLQNLLNSGDKSPPVQGNLWCKEAGKLNWKKMLFRIEGSNLFTLDVADSKLTVCRDLQQYDIYYPIDGKCKGAPTQYTFCLRPNHFGCTPASLIWYCSDSERNRQCWVVSLRLAKFGKKLRENYRELRSRFTESQMITQSQLRRDSEMNNSAGEGSPSKSRVAMDFTGSFGRVVEDPKEAQAIAAAEARNWKRRLPGCRSSPAGSTQSLSQSPVLHSRSNIFEFGVHSLQPWFYNNMSRDEATQLLTKYGTVDGVFLVRESSRNPGCFVLCYVFHQKVHHAQIIPVEEKGQQCFSLDGGRTKFYDILQLVEFYQLNIGSLPSKLTHFLVHRSKSKEQANTNTATDSHK